MTEQTVRVINTLGIHARPASLIVQTAGKYDCDIILEKDSVEANAKSIMSVMMLAATCDSEVVVRAKGRGEHDAVAAIVSLFDKKFNEE